MTVRLNMVIVRVERPPWAMLAGANAFVTWPDAIVTTFTLEALMFLMSTAGTPAAESALVADFSIVIVLCTV